LTPSSECKEKNKYAEAIVQWYEFRYNGRGQYLNLLFAALHLTISASTAALFHAMESDFGALYLERL